MDDETNSWSRRRERRLTRRHVVLGTVLGAGGAFLSAACGSKTGSPSGQGSAAGAPVAGTPQAGGTLSVGQTTNPPTLDPQRTTSFYTLLQAGAVHSRILRFKTGSDPHVAENHDVEGDLAVSFESPDAITWTVKLRPDAKFHNIAPVNGHAVEAQDVKATFNRATGKENPGRGLLDMIDPSQIATPDANTVLFTLKYPFAPFQSTLASSNVSWILPREADAGGYDPAKTPIGSGPFLFDSYTPDVAFTYKRNPDWFGKPQPYVSGLRWAVIPDTAQQHAQFTGGNLDLLGTRGFTAVGGFDVDALKHDNPKASIGKSDPTAGQLLFLQLGDPSSPFQDIRLRRAFSMGIDRDAIAKAIYNDDAVAQWYAPLSMGKWAMRAEQLPADTAQFYKYNPAMAKSLLQASGAADQSFKLIYATGYLGPAYEQAAQTTANMLQSAGIKISLVAVDYTKDFIAGGKGIRYGNYDKNSVVFAGLTGLADIDDYLFNYYHSKGTSGLSNLKDPGFDDQIAKARTVVNVDDRVKAYLEIQRYLADKMFTINGYHLPYVYELVAPRVANYQATVAYGLGTETFAKLWLKS
jgi:ABC-type transport system substrate-binding protein